MFENQPTMQMVLYLQVITHEQRYKLNSNRTTHALVEKSRKKVGASPKRDFHNLNFEHTVSSGLISECLLSAFSATVVVFGTWTNFLCGIFLDTALHSFLSLLGNPHYCVGWTKFITLCSRWFVEASAQLDAQ